MQKTITVAALSLLLAGGAYAQEAEYEHAQATGETPEGHEVRWDSQGVGEMWTWDDGDGNPDTMMVAGYVRSWAGIEGWIAVQVNTLDGTMEVVDASMSVPEGNPNRTFDGVNCRDRAGMQRVMWARFEGNMKAAVVSGAFGWWSGGPIGGIVGYTGTFTLRFLWDAGAVAWACRG